MEVKFFWSLIWQRGSLTVVLGMVSVLDRCGWEYQLTIFSLICKMIMSLVSVSRVFMKVCETVFGEHCT